MEFQGKNHVRCETMVNNKITEQLEHRIVKMKILVSDCINFGECVWNNTNLQTKRIKRNKTKIL
jgi:hypothetical protein